MPDAFFPLRFVLLLFAGLVNREQAKVVDYLREENRVLRELLGKRRLRLNDNQRARLAARAKALGRSALEAVATIVTPDTLLRWHRRLVAAKWTTQQRRQPGRPPVMARIRELAIRMAKENPTWGYTRIVGALANLGHEVARTTVAKILKAAGIAPAPERPTSWRTFLKAHAGVIAASDFFTVEVWTARGLATGYVIFGAVRPHHQARVPRPDDLLRRGHAASRAARVRRPLPRRAEPSGPRQPAAPARTWSRATRWSGPPTRATRRPAQLLRRRRAS